MIKVNITQIVLLDLGRFYFLHPIVLKMFVEFLLEGLFTRKQMSGKIISNIHVPIDNY